MPTLLKAIPTVSGHIYRLYIRIGNITFPIEDMYTHVKKLAVQADKEIILDLDKDVGWLGPEPDAAMVVVRTVIGGRPCNYLITLQIAATDG